MEIIEPFRVARYTADNADNNMFALDDVCVSERV
jgi:hypothetical protein